MLQALAKELQTEAWWCCSKLKLGLCLSTEMSQLMSAALLSEFAKRGLLGVLNSMEVSLLQLQADCTPVTNLH